MNINFNIIILFSVVYKLKSLGIRIESQSRIFFFTLNYCLKTQITKITTTNKAA
jgi:hypothetical protein